jgi:hypothetical protein
MNTRVKTVARALRDRRIILVKHADGEWKPLDLPRSTILKHVRSLAPEAYVGIRRLSYHDSGLIEYITKEELYDLHQC